MSKRKDEHNNNTRKNIIVILSVVVGLILVFLFGKWLLFDRITKSESLDLKSDEALTVMLKTKSYSYFDRLDSYKVKNLTNQEKLWFVVETDSQYNHGLNFYQENSKVKGEDVKKVFKMYFDSDLKNEDILCTEDGKAVFEYDKELDIYTYSKSNSHNHDIASNIYDKYFYPVEVSKKTNAHGDLFYVVKAKRMFGDSDTCEDVCGLTKYFYGTYKDSLNKKNAILDSKDFENWDSYFTSTDKVEELYNANKDKFPTYTYTFIKKNNDFYLQNVKVSK